MSQTTKEALGTLRAMLEAAAETPYLGHEAEWSAFTEHYIELPADYASAVYEATRRRGWENVKNPVTHIRKLSDKIVLASLGLKRRRALPEWKPVNFSDLPIVRDEDGFRLSVDEQLGALSLKYEDDPCDEDEGSWARSQIHESLLKYGPEPDAPPKVDWDKLADFLRLDEGVRRILALRRKGATRRQDLAGSRGEAERQERQGAWRRFTAKLPEIKRLLAEGIPLRAARGSGKARRLSSP